jgi:lipoprotein Spr
MPDEARVARARALMGTRFRLHGRDARTGLDCVGLVALAVARLSDAPLGYTLRTTRNEIWTEWLDRIAIRSDAPRPGDTVLLSPGPAQLHLGIWTGSSLIHADAGLGRVTETPAPLRWPVLGIWHLTEKE